jgi:hypothetical protein
MARNAFLGSADEMICGSLRGRGPTVHGLKPPSGPDGRETHKEWEQRRYRELDLLDKPRQDCEGYLRLKCMPLCMPFCEVWYINK